jgi:CheY-like chemotaxis protein
MRAFVVEDDPDVRDLIASLLEASGWTVHLAEDGIAALGGMHRAGPDLIVLDLLMPHLDGAEVLRLLRSTEFGRRIPVVVVTGAPVDDEVRALASAVLTKPFEIDELMRLTRSLTAAPSALCA